MTWFKKDKKMEWFKPTEVKGIIDNDTSCQKAYSL